MTPGAARWVLWAMLVCGLVPVARAGMAVSELKVWTSPWAARRALRGERPHPRQVHPVVSAGLWGLRLTF